MEQLKAELASIEQQLTAEKQKGSEGNKTIIERLELDQAKLLEQIMIAEQQERAQEIDKKVDEEAITFNVPGVDFQQLPAELITLIDAVVRADRRRIYSEEGAKFDKLIADQKETLRASDEREIQAVRQNDILQDRLSAVTKERDEALQRNAELVTQYSDLTTEHEDLEKRFKSATDQLEESQREVKRLTSEIQDMRASAQFGEKKAQQIIDVTPEETSSMQELVNNLAKKYVAVTPIGGNWHEVLAEDGSKEVLHTKDLPSLETQGSQFRGSDQAESQESHVLSAPAIASVAGPQFPSPTSVTPPDLQTVSAPVVEGVSNNEMVGTPATQEWVEERLAELEARITGDKVAQV